MKMLEGLNGVKSIYQEVSHWTTMDLFCVLGRGAIVLGSPESRKVRKFCFCPTEQTTVTGEVLEKAVWLPYEALGEWPKTHLLWQPLTDRHEMVSTSRFHLSAARNRNELICKMAQLTHTECECIIIIQRELGNQIAPFLSPHDSKVEGIGIDQSSSPLEGLLMDTTVFLKKFVDHTPQWAVSLKEPSEKVQFLYD